MLIERALESDVPAVLALQRLAFVTEAEIYGDYSIPPLVQSEESLLADFRRGVVLKAVEGGRIVGTVRGWCSGQTCHIGRLAVHPECRRRGLGTRLMAAIESAFAGAARFEIFTGGRSDDNIRPYRGLGYAELRRERLNDSVWLVFMEKVGSPDGKSAR